MGRVFLLGAGFSAAAGAPLARGVLAHIFLQQQIQPEISDLELWLQKHLFQDRNDWLQDADFEEVISRLELFEKYIEIPAAEEQKLGLKVNLLLREFIQMLQPKKLHQNLNYYDYFVRQLRDDDVIITFNYDLVVEESLIWNNLGVNYQLTVVDSPNFSKLDKSPELSLNAVNVGEIQSQLRIPVLKLHGSINLAFCANCLTIHQVSAEMLLCMKCNHQANSTLRPFIIPPTLFKSYALPEQRKLWYNAYKYLTQAAEIYIIGYSLPAADILAVQLLDFAQRSRQQEQQITVINGPKAELKQFKMLYPACLTNTNQSFLEWCRSYTL